MTVVVKARHDHAPILKKEPAGPPPVDLGRDVVELWAACTQRGEVGLRHPFPVRCVRNLGQSRARPRESSPLAVRYAQARAHLLDHQLRRRVACPKQAEAPLEAALDLLNEAARSQA